MIIYICAFTNSGREVAEEIAEALPTHIFRFFEVGDSLSKWVKDGFDIRAPFIFICASGIAVRSIAPYVTNKLVDSPVVVIDEKKKFVIPLLAGHVGGANELAYTLADILESTPVITTATDINGKFAVDVWAKENGLTIYNREGIGRISSLILRNEPIKLSIQTNIDIDTTTLPSDIILNYEDTAKNSAEVSTGGDTEGGMDVVISDDCQVASDCKLLLVPKRICIGIGCRKGISANLIEEQVNKAMAKYALYCEGIASGVGNIYDNIYGIASIDLKAKEYGIVEFAQKNGVKFVTFSAEELKNIEGEFEESKFVENVTGISNVCERAAVKLAGDGGRLVIKKQASNGVTVAIAIRYHE